MAGRLVGGAWAVFFGLGGASVWLGCNALAGIELGTLADSPGDGGHGGEDATTAGDATASGSDSGQAEDTGSPRPDGAMPMMNDGGAPEASAPKTFACSPSNTPITVASLENADGGRIFDTEIALGITQNQQARVLVRLIGNQGGGNQGNTPQEVFRAYDVEWQQKMVEDTAVIMAPPGSNFSETLVTPNGMTAIVTQSNYDNDAGYFMSVEAYPFPANQQNLNSAPPPYALTPAIFPSNNSNNNQSAGAIELGTEDDFVVTNTGPLQSNVATRDGGPTMPTTFANMGPTQGGGSPTLIRGGNNVYAVYGSDPTSDAGTLIYKIADNGVNSQPVTPGVLPGNTVIAGATESSTDPTKVVTYAATLVTTPVVEFSLFSGLVDANSFDKLQISALTPGPALMLHDVPANKGSTTFVGDQLVLLGLSPVAADQGLNFVWIDSAGHVLAEAVGANRLYADRPGIQASAIAALDDGLAGVLTTFFVAWIEQHSDAAGTYDVVYLDEYQCAAN